MYRLDAKHMLKSLIARIDDPMFMPSYQVHALNVYAIIRKQYGIDPFSQKTTSIVLRDMVIECGD